MATNIQVRFDSVNPGAPQHTLAPGEVATATNIDFSYEPGALSPRRGSYVLAKFSGLSGRKVIELYKNYISDTSSASPLYVNGDGVIVRYVNSTASVIANAMDINGYNSISSFQQYTLMGGRTNIGFKDDGVNTTDWVKQSPPAPTITVNTLTPLDLTVAGTNTFTVVNGSLVSGTLTATFVTDANNRAQVSMVFAGPPQNLNVNGTNTIGAFGVHFIDLAFSDPTLVTKVSQDYSVGDANFYNYFHTELTPTNGIVDSAQPDPVTLIYNQLGVGTLTSSSPTADQRADMIGAIKIQNQPTLSGISHLSSVLAPWGVTRPDFSLVGPYNPAAGVDPWTQIYAVQYTIEATGTLTCTIRKPAIYGAINYPLTDINVGYTYWQTFATLDSSNNKVGESAPSPPTTQYKMQEANASVVLAGTATGAHGITHVITYRQGGYTTTPYAVNTATYVSSASFTDSMNDIQAISLDFPLQLNVYSKASAPAPRVVSEPFQSTVFYGNGNTLYWSVPGQLDTFPLNYFLTVSYGSDLINNIIAWPPGLIIINAFSVYELVGNDFTQGQFSLSRTGSKKGSAAPRTAIKTPYGIPLLDVNGLTLYQPGQGIDEEVTWFKDYLDMFKGTGTDAPAVRKGGRIPALNSSVLNLASAVYGQDRLYIAAASGSDSTPKTVYIFDFNLKKVWWYTYPFAIYCMLWDQQTGNILAGSDDGAVFILESRVNDIDPSNLANDLPIQWTAKTKQWSVNSDCVLENLNLESEGGTNTYTAVYDGSTTALATLTATTRNWQTPPLNGSFANNVSFNLTGSRAINDSQLVNNIYQLTFDLMDEPGQVRYLKTPYDEKQYAGDKLWDVAYYDLEARGTATDIIKAVTFVDSTAVMTATFTSPFGRTVTEKSFPGEIYGRIAYTTYTSTNTALLFKPWNTYFDARPEPAKINYFRTDIESLEENICDGYDADINPNGAVLATAYVDNVAVATASLTGGNRQSFASTFPTELYGRTLYVVYTGSAFKHYKTWFHLRREPDRWTSFVTERQSEEESIWDAFDVDINPLGGTVTATAFLDTNTLGTFTATGSLRHSYTFTLPPETYGRTGWVQYIASGSGKFKHYKTWFHTRPEPDRWFSYVTDKFSTDEHEWKVFKPELNCLGNIVLATAFVNGTGVGTYTITGSTRQQYTFSIPPQTFGRTVWAEYIGSDGIGGSAAFKHYKASGADMYKREVEFEGDVEPPRVTTYRTGPYPFPSSNYLKTWLPRLDVLNGTVTGTLTVDDAVLTTQTFTGNKQQWYTVGLDIDVSNAIQTASRWEALYSASAQFKHYETKMESEPKPFGKNVWAYSYRKLGGASQLDLARFWSIEADSPGTSTGTYFWDVNGTNFTTGTITFTGGIQWEDRLSLPPGMRGYIFLFRLKASSPIKISKVNLDMEQEGIKNLVRREVPGTPQGPG